MSEPKGNGNLGHNIMASPITGWMRCTWCGYMPPGYVSAQPVITIVPDPRDATIAALRAEVGGWRELVRRHDMWRTLSGDTGHYERWRLGKDTIAALKKPK